MSLVFVVGAGIFAWRMKEPLGGVAMAAFPVYQAILVHGAIAGVRPNSVAMTALLTVFAALLTASGARDGSLRRFAMAGIAFVTTLAFSFGARYYADVFIGNHSVVSPIC